MGWVCSASSRYKNIPYLTQRQTQPPSAKQHFLLCFEPIQTEPHALKTLWRSGLVSQHLQATIRLDKRGVQRHYLQQRQELFLTASLWLAKLRTDTQSLGLCCWFSHALRKIKIVRKPSYKQMQPMNPNLSLHKALTSNQRESTSQSNWHSEAALTYLFNYLTFVSTSVAKGSSPAHRWLGEPVCREAWEQLGLSKQQTKQNCTWKATTRKRSRRMRRSARAEAACWYHKGLDERVMEGAASLHLPLSNALHTSSHGTFKGLKDTFVMNKCTISVDVEAGTSSLHCGAMLFLLPLDGGGARPFPICACKRWFPMGKALQKRLGGLLCEKQKLKWALVENKTKVGARVRVPRITAASTRPSRAKRSKWNTVTWGLPHLSASGLLENCIPGFKREWVLRN